MKKLNLREVKDTAKAIGGDESLAQSLDLSYITSQTRWEVQCGYKFIWHRNHVIWPPWSYISIDLGMIMCTHQLDVPASKHLLLFIDWISGDIQYLTNLKERFTRGEKIVAYTRGWYTALLLSIRSLFELALFTFLFPENYRVLFAFPLKHCAVWCLWAFSWASHSIWNTHSSSFLPFHSHFFRYAFSGVHSDFGGHSVFFWISLPCASFYHCPYHTVCNCLLVCIFYQTLRP